MVTKTDSIEENIKNKYYETSSIEYPKDYPDKNKIKEEFKDFVGTLKQINDKIDEVYDGRMNERRETINKRNKELSNLTIEFKHDLFKDYNVVNNPKAERCYSLAWDDAHSDGFMAVYHKFDELVDLIK